MPGKPRRPGDLVTSLGYIRREFRAFLYAHTSEFPEWSGEMVFAPERQLHSDVNGWLLCVVQIAIWGVIADWATTFVPGGPQGVQMIAPYPPQLKAYIRKTHGVGTENKTRISRGHATLTHQSRRLSSHKAEAWFLTQLARDVLSGDWKFKQKVTTPTVAPWTLIYSKPESA